MTNEELLNIEFLSKKYDETNIPLYVSYPTTNWWRSRAEEKCFSSVFHSAIEPFLYFHLPYCNKACYYCCCYKYVSTDASEIDTYVDYLIKEYNQKLDMAEIDILPNIRQIHWGGGTPTYLSMPQIEKIYTSISKRAKIDSSMDSNISIEAYPDSQVISLDKLKLLRQLGFNEISFGIQDFDERIQQLINRSCDIGTVHNLIEQSRSLGFKVHVDLCYGLPFQGQNEFERTAKEVIKLGPDRVAVFPYAHYPLMYPMQRLIPGSSVPNSLIKVLLAKIANDVFIGSGYGRVGSDHFVRKDNRLFKDSIEKKVERDFMGYSVEERKQFIGFGNSAISFLGNTLFHNLAPMEEYYRSILSGGIALNKTLSHTLSQDDKIRKNIILKHILTDMSIDKNKIETDFGISFDSYFKNELEILKTFEKDGLIKIGKSIIDITNNGIYFSRHIAFVFDTYYKK